MIVDPEKVASVIEEIAEAEILSRYGKLAKKDIDTKSGPNDFVTAADHAAEAALRRALLDIYPCAGFIGEEGVAGDPQSLAQLEGNGAFWIVDPLDGTRNFIERVDEFGTIVALVVDGETQAGWIYGAPDRKIAIGMRGDGVSWDGERMSASNDQVVALTGYRAIGNLAEPWKSRLIPQLKTRFEDTTGAMLRLCLYQDDTRAGAFWSLFTLQPVGPRRRCVDAERNRRESGISRRQCAL